LSEPNNWGGVTAQGGQDFDLLFRGLEKDKDRILATSWKRLPPFPIARDPPPPVTPERVQEILNDPRVQAQQTRERSVNNVN